MPIRNPDGGTVKYYLCVFDEHGKERQELDGSLLSETILRRLASTPAVTDIFVTVHGWQGDVSAAIRQYDAWVGEVAKSSPTLAPFDGIMPNLSRSSSESIGRVFRGATKQFRPMPASF